MSHDKTLFICPKCGGTCFGTIFPDGVDRWDTAVGVCSGHAVGGSDTGPCGFKWPRSRDDEVFCEERIAPTTAPVRERPILFSGPMVRALLAGRKTQTRRVVKPQPRKDADDVFTWFGEGVPPSAPQGPHGCWEGWVERRSDPCCGEQVGCVGFLTPCPYGAPGDRLWVRETFGRGAAFPVYAAGMSDAIRRQGPRENTDDHNWRDYMPNRWTPSIFMRRRESRITLEVEAVRVERVQEISEADALAEGCPGDDLGLRTDRPRGELAVAEYAALWDSINAKRGFPWASNPWVWVVSFKRLEGA